MNVIEKRNLLRQLENMTDANKQCLEVVSYLINHPNLSSDEKNVITTMETHFTNMTVFFNTMKKVLK